MCRSPVYSRKKCLRLNLIIWVHGDNFRSPFLLVRMSKFVRLWNMIQNLWRPFFPKFLCGSRILTMIEYASASIIRQQEIIILIVHLDPHFLPRLQIDWLNRFLELMWPYLNKVLYLLVISFALSMNLLSLIDIECFVFLSCRLSAKLHRKSLSQLLPRILQNIRQTRLSSKLLLWVAYRQPFKVSDVAFLCLNQNFARSQLTLTVKLLCPKISYSDDMRCGHMETLLHLCSNCV